MQGLHRQKVRSKSGRETAIGSASPRPRSQDRCLLTKEAIFNISKLATGMTAFKAASGLIVRPSLSPFFLMYTQIFLVTSVRGRVFAPQIPASASLSFFGAKMPFPD